MSEIANKKIINIIICFLLFLMVLDISSQLLQYQTIKASYIDLLNEIDDLREKLNVSIDSTLRIIKETNIMGKKVYLVEWVSPNNSIVAAILDENLRVVLYARIHGATNDTITRSLLNDILNHTKALSMANKFIGINISMNISGQSLDFLKLYPLLFLNESDLYTFSRLLEVNNISIPQANVSVNIDALSGGIIECYNESNISRVIDPSLLGKISINLSEAEKIALDYFKQKPQTIDARVTCHALCTYVINGSLRPVWLICVEQKSWEETKLSDNEKLVGCECRVWEVYIDPYTGQILKLSLRSSGCGC